MNSGSKKYRVYLLGGAGEVGQYLTEYLNAQDDVEELIVGDRSERALADLAERLSSSKVRTEIVDLTDPRTFRSSVAGADLLINCTSLVWADDVIAVAAREHVNYCDLMSEPSDESRQAAHDSGILAITGLGSSPGATNVLARHAYNEFDRLNSVEVQNITWRAIAPTKGLLDAVLWELADGPNAARFYRAGRFHSTRAMEGSKVCTFPDPVGEHRVYFAPQSEGLTIPQLMPDLEFCATRVSWPDDLMEDIAVLNKYGLLDRTPLSDGRSAFDSTREQIWAMWGGRRTDPCLLFHQVEVSGVLKGQAVRRIYDLTHPLHWGREVTGRVTGISAAVLAHLMLQKGRVGAPGFVTPESYFDPELFVDRIKDDGVLDLSWNDVDVGPREPGTAV